VESSACRNFNDLRESPRFDCKSVCPGSIPGEASNYSSHLEYGNDREFDRPTALEPVAVVLCARLPNVPVGLLRYN